MILLRELLSEYTDEEKSQMGIPLDAVAVGGAWFVGKQYVGKVEDGKFIRATKHQFSTATEKDTEPNTVDKDDEKKPQTSTQQISGVELRPTLTFDNAFNARRFDGRWSQRHIDFINSMGIDQEGFENYPETWFKPSDEENAEIQQHASAVNGSELVSDWVIKNKELIYMWQETGIWRSPKEMREMLFTAMDTLIDNNNLRVKHSPYLYRGIHNHAGRQTHITYEVFTKYRQGEIINLPPAGFSLDLSQALEFGKIGSPKLGILFRLINKPEGVRAMQISEVTFGYAREKEVITRSGEYKILSVKMQPIMYSEDPNPNETGKFIMDDGTFNLYAVSALAMFIDLEQLDNTNEQVKSKSSETITDILFGDTMRGTEKNIKILEKKWSKK